jgi:hypothetical protein
VIAARGEREEAQREVNALRQSVESQREIVLALETRLEELKAPLPTPTPRAFLAREPVRARPGDTSLPQAPDVAPRVAVTLPSNAVPTPDMRLRAPVPPPKPSAAAPVPTPAPPVPTAVPTPGPPAPVVARAAPASGKVLWSGELARDASLVIEQGKPSRGFLNGKLPSGPIRVGAYPAELSGAGLRVFTANARAAAAEAPAANNG